MLLESKPRVRHQRLAEKYRPISLNQMIVSPHTRIQAIQAFWATPYPEACLFAGSSGLGKTSVARIMASQLASHPIHVRHLAGNDVDVYMAREIERDLSTQPLYGGFGVCIIDEADAISAGASVRLLACLDRLTHGIMIMTSNAEIGHFDPRFRSRLLQVPFSAHGLAPRAIHCLQEIAGKEGLKLSENEAEAIVRQAKTNLRECLKVLEGRLLDST